MTYREGFKQAMRELGDDEATIDARMKAVGLMVPWPEDKQLPAELERPFIDNIKNNARTFITEIQTNPKAFNERLDKKLAEVNRAN